MTANMGITGLTSSSNRIRTIDVLRALTMFFMIFVNDLWTLTGVPEWLKHTLAEEDGMGFSDVIFPLFLFIVGLSIPLAVETRIKKTGSVIQTLGHILLRTLALLVMGFYMVNSEVFNQEATGIDKNFWRILMALAIFLIWLDYKRLPDIRKGLVLGTQALGVSILIYLAWIYRGGTAESISLMQPRWWGILGLIGWAYLLNSLLYVIARERLIIIIAAFIFLLFMNVQESGFFKSLPSFRLVISASNHVLVMAGMLCTIAYMEFSRRGKQINQLLGLFILAGGLFLIYGFLIRPTFPISKIYATPSWVAICIGISLFSYVLIYTIVDKLGYYRWTDLIKPAGTSTLTCYLIPYFVYPIMALTDFHLPGFLTDGVLGIIKSLLFSLLIILFVGLLERRNVRLRI